MNFRFHIGQKENPMIIVDDENIWCWIVAAIVAITVRMLM